MDVLLITRTLITGSPINRRLINWRAVSLCFWTALGALTAVTAPAAAQSIQWGIWGEPPERHRAEPSFLGVPPASIAPKALGEGGGRPEIAGKEPATIAFENGFEPGSIIIDTAARKLYYTLSRSEAYAYPVAVGKEGFTWTGVERVSRIERWPDWIPPAEMRQRKPSLPIRMTGGLNNPLGARAIYLGTTLYRIHGTNDANSIGSAASSGCFRMHNAHVVHLAGLVEPGTLVFVVKRLPKDGPAMPPEGTVQVTAPVEAAPPGVPPPAAAPGEAPGQATDAPKPALPAAQPQDAAGQKI
ncbi:MAG: L,D-transpeptidase [Hyphomicrobium sp.]|jgi:lipoprotein-anchoring transpeptidase ErfK/SrfK